MKEFAQLSQQIYEIISDKILKQNQNNEPEVFRF